MSVITLEQFKVLTRKLNKLTKEQCFNLLVDEGIYNKDGTLTPEYGGKKRDK